MVVVAFSLLLLYYENEAFGRVIEYPSIYLMLVVTVMHMAFFWIFVTRSAVLEASTQYGRQLVSAIEGQASELQL